MTTLGDSPSHPELDAVVPSQDSSEQGVPGWVLRLWLVVVLFGAVTVTRSVLIGVGLRDPHHSMLVSRLALSLGMLAVGALGEAAWRGRGSAVPYLTRLRERWTRRRTLLAISALVAYHLIYFCYHNLKAWDAFLPSQDAMLLRWDKWLFFGHSPAVLLHDLLGRHAAAFVLTEVYEAFSAVLAVAVVASLVFTRQIRDGFVFIAAGIWIWILGVASYYLIPSQGPFNSAPQEFAGLQHTSVEDTQARYMHQWDYMRAHPHASDAFAQVSAFASLHVALTCLVFLGARYYRLRRTSWFLLFWLVATMTATVYLGWHFAVDDFAGLAIAYVGVWLGRRTIYPDRRSEPVR